MRPALTAALTLTPTLALALALTPAPEPSPHPRPPRPSPGPSPHQVSIPCVMMLEDDGMQLKQAVQAARQPVLLGLYDPTQRPTLLRSGYPQDGVARPNAASHYLLRVAGAHAVNAEHL